LRVLFADWESLLEVVIRAAAGYLAIMILMRLVGDQALGKMSAYDLIVTISLGGMLAAIPLDHRISIADGLVAIATMVGIQELIRLVRARSRRARRMTSAPPRLVVWNGRYLDDRIAQWSVTHDEIRAAVRRQGSAAIEDIQAVVMENDGAWSVIPKGPDSARGSAFAGLDVPAE
jgi:uncharacterized membrane protein YcaP (DUF421 family)